MSNNYITITGKEKHGGEFTREISKETETFSLEWPTNLVSLNLSELKHCKKIKKISIQHMEYLRELDITCFASLPDLEKVYFLAVNIVRLDLSPLASCKKLKELILDYSNFEKIDLTPLAGCPEFETLNLSHGILKELDLAPLASCKKLKKVSLWRNPLGELNLAPLASSTKLETLFLEDNNLKKIDLTPLENCTALKEVNLENNHLETVDLAPLQALSNLEYINFTANKLKELDLEPISNCPSLSYIDLCHNKDLRKLDLSSFNAPALSIVEAHRCGIEEVDLTGLIHSKRLKHLRLGGNKIKEIDLTLIKSVELESIDLGPNELEYVDLTPITNSKTLQHIDLSDNNLTQLNLQPIAGCSSLRILELQQNKLVNIDLVPLKNCRSLVSLSLENNLLEKLNLEPLALLTNLETLSLAQNPLIGLADCCGDEKECPELIILPPLATSELDFAPLKNNSRLREITYDYCCKVKNIESLPSKSKQIVYSYLTGYCEDGSRRYLLIDTTAKKISLDFKGLVKIDLTPLKQLNDIKFLDLSNNLLSSFELKTVQSGSLRKLDLAKNYLSSVNLAEIRESFPNLEEIDLSYNELQTLDLESLKGWESLKIIGLNGNKKLKLDLAPLINCPNLVEIIASEEQELEAQGQTAEKLRIKRETVLEGIHKDGSKFIEELFDPEENPKKHIQIFSSEPVMEIDFEKIASILSEIETISMTFLELEKIDLAPLAGCPNLRELRLGGNNFSTIDLHPLENCYQLEEVDLGNNENLEELDITPLLNLKKLKAFYVSDDVKLYAKQSALIGELPIELRDFYSETIQWYQ